VSDLRKLRIDVAVDRIADFRRRHRTRRLAFFGSVLRGDFRPDSDVDVLVRFTPGLAPGFMALYDLEQELSGLLGGRTVISSWRGF